MTLPDGRRLAYQALGAEGTPAALVLHGTPGSSRQLAGLDRPARDRGLALIVPDRAGYGGSTHDASRTIASSARDLGELIRHRLVVKTARRSQAATRLMFAAAVRAGRTRPDRTLDRFTSLLAEADARLLRENGDLRAGFLDDLRHPAPTTARATARDFWLFARRWDVDIAEVAVPAHIWHGTEDRNVPVAHARVIAATCPAARLHIVEGGGHMLLGQLDQIIEALTPHGE
jgi:pimeloyl-ACP methyl ester carboxylesterase